MSVEANFAAFSQKVTGKVIDILPTLDTTSRTIKVRIELPILVVNLSQGCLLLSI
jgi:Cu(I)/Ag(I) efflux system membrane fusion protein